MAGRRKQVTFHGAFTAKRKAASRAVSVGGFIRTVSVKGRKRYIVMKKR